MIVDLSAIRRVITDRSGEIVFYAKMNSSAQLNSYAIPLMMYYVMNHRVGDNGAYSITPDALLFGGCEVLRQINNYFTLYKR